MGQDQVRAHLPEVMNTVIAVSFVLTVEDMLLAVLSGPLSAGMNMGFDLAFLMGRVVQQLKEEAAVEVEEVLSDTRPPK